MSKQDSVRLSKLVREFNVKIDRILEFLSNKGISGLNPNSKISKDVYMQLLEEFDSSKAAKISAQLLAKEQELKKAEEIIKQEEEERLKEEQDILKEKNKIAIKVKKDLEVNKDTSTDESLDKKNDNVIKAKSNKIKGVTQTGKKIDLTKFDKPAAASNINTEDSKKKRKRILKKKIDPKKFNNSRKPKTKTIEISPEETQKRVRETLAKLQGSGKKSSVKNRKEKRDAHKAILDQEIEEQVKSDKVIKITEFATANELASLMNISVTEIITSCMSLGIMVSMNQRLDAETIEMLIEDFGLEVEFVTADIQEDIQEEVDNEEDMIPRAPIVTIMGHVDHGKTSLMDYIRNSNVIAGESGGITQHIGAYEVTLKDNKKISFLDTPGHAAFTAMRARGAKVTDIVIVVVAADDKVMPQTKEAISHAQAAGVPIIFAINKIDIPTADPEKIKGELAEINMLVEDWGGKYQSNDISAKEGTGIQELLEKVLLESEMLALKANPNRNAQGTVVEASLDKGKGFLSTILVQKGTLKVGDYVLAGRCSGKVKALLDERGNKRDEAGPSTPVVLLGLDGAPTAGDEFFVMDSEQEAKKIAAKRMQLEREQSVRTQKHLTLDEIGRRIALGEFQEINIIVKGDVDGSIEALSDSLEGLSNEEIKINIIQKAVGQISESDVMLAAASNAIVIGFQVRPSLQARKLAETENIDIRLYSIIYKAIEDLKLAMEGMLSPDVEEKIICNIEIRDIFKISKVGTIAGCMVLDGNLSRKSKVRLIRDGVVVYTGNLSSLKRFKEDVNEVKKGFECGMSIENFNDIKVGDIIEGYDNIEIKRELS
ncbi:MAG: translation initiation factor IF-2 [Flavobacteriales bacterium]|nr:translation initiation factor IF-2 [Flavobacteriales bacterium]